MLLATHLLDDVQQVCDHVVMIDGGTLVVCGATSSLLERTGQLSVDVGPDRDVLVAALAKRKIAATGRPGSRWRCSSMATPASISCEISWPSSAFPFTGCRARHSSLDDVFLRRAQGGAS